MANWRDKVDPTIKNYLEVLIKESAKSREPLSEAENPANAQIWVALATVSKQMFDLNQRMNIMERALRDSLRKPVSNTKVVSRKPVRKAVKKVTKKRKATSKRR